jgi:hypothetical protein
MEIKWGTPYQRLSAMTDMKNDAASIGVEEQIVSDIALWIPGTVSRIRMAVLTFIMSMENGTTLIGVEGQSYSLISLRISGIVGRIRVSVLTTDIKLAIAAVTDKGFQRAKC